MLESHQDNDERAVIYHSSHVGDDVGLNAGLNVGLGWQM